MQQEHIFGALEQNYRKGIFSVPTVYYFSIDEVKKTVTLDGAGCSIEDGKTVE